MEGEVRRMGEGAKKLNQARPGQVRSGERANRAIQTVSQ